MINRRVRLGLTLTVTLMVVWTFTPVAPRVSLGILTKHHHSVRTKATNEEKRHNKALALSYADVGYGWKGREGACLIRLWSGESRFDNYAKNQRGSSAYGIAQHLGERSSDPSIQILRGLRYISYRYYSPCRAETFHRRHNWY